MKNLRLKRKIFNSLETLKITQTKDILYKTIGRGVEPIFEIKIDEINQFNQVRLEQSNRRKCQLRHKHLTGLERNPSARVT